MFIKQRSRPAELSLLACLHRRMDLDEKDQKRCMALEKGYVGECKFDSWLEDLHEERVVLCDLTYQLSNHTRFQIDTLVISQEGVKIFEVKNYQGDYEYKKDNFYILGSNGNINNPLHQLNRSETLFKLLLQQLGLTFPVSGYVVFVNPQFTLYHAPDDCPMIFPTQIKRFIQSINSNPSRLTKRHHALVEKLIEAQDTSSPYEYLPDYCYENLRKGIPCKDCGALDSVVTDEHKKLVCEECGCKEKVRDAVIRSIEEYGLLFPQRKITTNDIFDWCQVIESKKVIRSILQKHFTQCGKVKHTYFVSSQD